MKLAIGCDHAGYSLKEALKSYLVDKGFDIVDMGTDGPESVDYPDFVHPVSLAIIDGSVDLGILICGSGNGVSMTANKYTEVRCAICWNPEIAVLSREHNNANALAIPARFVELNEAYKIVDSFCESSFEGGRHERRIGKMAPKLDHYC